MAGIDIYADPLGTNDIEFDESGDFRWTLTKKESITQQVKILLSTWLGEWSFNTDFGMPYTQRLLVGDLTEDELNAEVKKVIIDNISDITSVTSIVAEWDRDNRIVSMTLNIYYDEEELEIPVFNAQTALNTYPEPRSFQDFEICALDDNADLESINAFHEYVNYQLPEGYSSSWFNEWVSA